MVFMKFMDLVIGKNVGRTHKGLLTLTIFCGVITGKYIVDLTLIPGMVSFKRIKEGA